MIVYMQITDDKFGLPVRIADSPTELDDALGRPHGSVSQSMSRAKKNGTWCQFIKVNTEKSFYEVEWKPKKKRFVAAYYPDGNLYRIFESIHDAAAEIKKSEQVIRNCINGKQKQASGLIWKWLITEE